MLNLVNLDDRTRALMLEELALDESNGRLGVPDRLKRLNDRGKVDFPALLRSAVQSHDATWLAAELKKGRMVRTELRKTAKGISRARVPANAAELLAECEFNRLYGRAVCRRAMEEGREEVLVYRAKEVREPRPVSLQLVGKTLPAPRLLDDIRSHPGEDTECGLFAPNSGVSVRLPDRPST